MYKKEIRQYQRFLEGERRKLTGKVSERINQLRSISEDPDSKVGDYGDLAMNFAEEDLARKLTEMRSMNLSQINRTLAKIDDGTFGVCSDCGGKIHDARLKALPWADRCITCEIQKEQAEAVEAITRQRLVSRDSMFDEA